MKAESGNKAQRVHLDAWTTTKYWRFQELPRDRLRRRERAVIAALRSSGKTSPPSGKQVVVTRGISQPHTHSPAGDIIAMVSRHRAHNRGVGPFLPSLRKANF